MSDTDLLREAAARVRETATAAAPGPWHMDEGQRIYAEDGAYVTSPWTNDERDDDLDHIALWHPGVALAVADLLDSEATHHVDDPSFERDTDPLCDTWPHAVRIARALVGEGE